MPKHGLIFKAFRVLLIAFFIVVSFPFVHQFSFSLFHGAGFAISTEAITKVAVEKGDPSICRGLQNVFLQHVQAFPNPLEWKIDGCISSIATKTRDKAVCEAMIQDGNRDMCLSNLAAYHSEIVLCDTMGPTFTKILCYQAVNPSLNQPITGSPWLNYDQIKGMQTVHCDKLENLTDRGRCYRFIVEFNRGKNSICNNLPEGESRDLCALGKMGNSPSENVCTAMTADWVKDICYKLLKRWAIQWGVDVNY